MTSPWPTVKLEDVCNFYSGSTPNRKNREYWDRSDVPWFTIDDYRTQGKFICSTQQSVTHKALAETSLKTVPHDSVLVCCTASVGEVCIASIDLTMNQQFNAIKAKNSEILDTLFLYYSMVFSSETLRELGRSTTVSFVSQSKLKKFCIPLPPLEEQKRIVAKLDEALGAVDALKANTAQSKSELDAFWQSALTQAFSSDWPVSKLGDVCNLTMGRTPSRSNPKFWDKEKKTGNLWVSIADLPLQPMREIYSTKEHISDQGAALFAPVPAGTMLMSFKLSIGRTAFASQELRTNEAIIAFRDLNEALCYNRFLGYYLTYFDWTQETEGEEKVKGATLNKGKLVNFLVPLPPLEEQKRIVAKLDVIKSELDRQREILTHRELETERLRSSILTAAFNGEL